MTLGQVYPTVESGWVRYDDTHPIITYSTGWVHTDVSGALQNTYRLANKVNETIKFNFTGTAIRFISGTNSNLTKNIGVNIDGKDYSPYSIYNSSLVWNRCVFEAIDLPDREHNVIITTLDTSYSVFDGIDLISGNVIKPYNEVTYDNSFIYHNGQYKKWIPQGQGTAGQEYPLQKLTSHSSDPTFIVSASSEWGSGYLAYQAFTKTNTGGTDRYPTSSGQLSGWLKVRLATPLIFNKYTVEATGRAGEVTSTIKDWVLEGSNNDLNWVILDIQSQTNWSLAEARSFNIPNTNKYTYYRIRFTTNNGYPSNTQIGELRFFEMAQAGAPAHWSIIDSIDSEGFDIATVPKESLDELDGNFEVITKTKAINPPKVFVTGQSTVMSPFVYPNRNISIIGVQNIDSISVNGIGNGKIAFSVNSGTSWLAYRNGNWIGVNNASNGMSFAEVNALTKEQLTQLVTDSKAIQFSYYLTSDTEIDFVQMRVSMQGIERLANRSEYEVSYDQPNKTIKYDILASGNYTITWVDAK